MNDLSVRCSTDVGSALYAKALVIINLLQYEDKEDLRCDRSARSCDIYMEVCTTSQKCTRKDTHSRVDNTVGFLFKDQPKTQQYNPSNWYLTRWSGSFPLTVHIYDYDSFWNGADDYEGAMHYTFRGHPGGHTNVTVGMTGHSRVRLTFQITVKCQPRYYGPNCTTLCVENTHYRCNADGIKVCRQGFTGTNCNTKDHCIPGICNHGNCTSLANSYKCTCSAGYTGQNCTSNINACSSNPCHHGSCTDGVHTFSCNCDAGFTGQRCETNINDCNTNPCRHGNCTDGINTFSCNCDAGFTGQQCETNINDCNPDPCHYGNCTDGINTFSCNCDTGFTGQRCETNINDCNPNSCLHGNCTDGVNQFSCNCDAGFTGQRCETNINDCNPNPCRHGNCTDGINTFSCNCDTGFTGQQCETNINDCIPNPCHHGNCSDGVNTFSCNCDAGFTGHRCETNINDCSPNPCRNGNCTDRVNTFSCSCQAGYSGKLCEQHIDPCVPNPCKNHGVCQEHANKYLCLCHHRYTGQNCQTELFPSSETPSQTIQLSYQIMPSSSEPSHELMFTSSVPMSTQSIEIHTSYKTMPSLPTVISTSSKAKFTSSHGIVTLSEVISKSSETLFMSSLRISMASEPIASSILTSANAMPIMSTKPMSSSYKIIPTASEQIASSSQVMTNLSPVAMPTSSEAMVLSSEYIPTSSITTKYDHTGSPAQTVHFGTPITDTAITVSPTKIGTTSAVGVSITSVGIWLLGDVSDDMTRTVRDHVIELLQLSNTSSLTVRVSSQLTNIVGDETVTNVTISISSSDSRPQVSREMLATAVFKTVSTLQLREYHNTGSVHTQTATKKSWAGDHAVLIGIVAATVTVVLILTAVVMVMKKRHTLREGKETYLDDEGVSNNIDMEPISKNDQREFENPMYGEIDC